MARGARAAVLCVVISALVVSGGTAESFTSRKLLQQGSLGGPATATDCSVVLSGTTSGTFASPLVSGAYPPSTSCMYYVRVAAQRSVYVTFNSFRLETSTGCVNDYLVMFDPLSNATSPLATYCNGDGTVPLPLQTTGRVLLAIFVSDSTTENLGFTASYTTRCEVGKWGVSGNCGGSCNCLLARPCDDAGACPDQNGDGVPDCAAGYAGNSCDVCTDSGGCPAFDPCA